MNERAKQIEDALLAIRMAPDLAHSLGKYCETAEQRQMNNTAAYQQALAIKHRVEFGGPVVTIDEAIEVYGNAQVLCEFGRREGRPAGLELHMRDGLIMFYLRLLHGCGLAVTSHRAGGDGKDLPDDKRTPSLAWAMAKATGIGESVITAAWRKHEFPTAEWG